jgi:DNA polymerase III subunit delta
MNRLYLLLGPEAGEKRLFLEGLRKEAGSDSESYSFYTFETRVYEIVSLLRNGALFSSRKLVFVKDAEQLKKKEDIDPLADYLKNPAPDSVLILLSSETRLDDKLERLLEGVKPPPIKKVFWELYEEQKEKWILDFFSARKIGIGDEAVGALLQTVENTTDALRTECERLALFYGAGGTVDSDAVYESLYHSRAESVFTLFDAMAARDFPRALAVLDTVISMKESDPAGVFAGLAWQFNRLRSFAFLTDGGRSDQDAFRELRVFGKKAQRQLRETRDAFGMRETENIIRSIGEFEALCRSYPKSLENSFMQLFLYSAMIKKAPLEKYPSPFPAFI